MTRPPRLPFILLLVLLALAAGGFVWLQRPEMPSDGPPQASEPAATRPANGTALAAVKQPAVTALPPPPAGGKTRQQAYLFAVRGGNITLERVDLLQGDFHRRRGPQRWLPGMWCVRFLDAEMRVLAQETAAAPDEPCVVLDPNVPNADGAPQATKLKLTDDVMMQMRVPPVPGASLIKIYRIAGTQPAALDVEPLGQLLASIPLPR